MVRANRYILPGHIYHLTHRCHNRAFLLKFNRDRNTYRNWLREGVGRYKVSILGYCITCNHIHLILVSKLLDAISKFMQLVQGSMAQQYNRRKGRKGAYWEDRYHCTIVDSGRYLWNCLLYVDLNMVRAGVINKPEDWGWCGFNEFMGKRKRYRLLDLTELLDNLGYADIAEAREQYREEIELLISGGDVRRNPIWTESLAVGRKDFVHSLESRFHRIRTEVTEEASADGSRAWSIREIRKPYNQ